MREKQGGDLKHAPPLKNKNTPTHQDTHIHKPIQRGGKKETLSSRTTTNWLGNTDFSSNQFNSIQFKLPGKVNPTVIKPKRQWSHDLIWASTWLQWEEKIPSKRKNPPAEYLCLYLYRFIQFISFRNKSQTNLNHNLFNPTCVYTSVLALKPIRALCVFNFYFVIF